MVKFLGRAEMPGVCLKYFVFGNRHSGYSICIQKVNGEMKDQFVCKNLSSAIRFGEKLRRGFVFPETLSEILEDMQVAVRDTSPNLSSSSRT